MLGWLVIIKRSKDASGSDTPTPTRGVQPDLRLIVDRPQVLLENDYERSCIYQRR